jgi:hypothetical protein
VGFLIGRIDRKLTFPEGFLTINFDQARFAYLGKQDTVLFERFFVKATLVAESKTDTMQPLFGEQRQ